MKSQFKRFFIFSRIALVVLQNFAPLEVDAAVPSDYRPNYIIEKDRTEIQDLLVKIQASKQVGASIPSATFGKLYNDFTRVFTYFPNKPEFKTVYEQCLITTQILSNGFDYNNFSLFSNNCFDPLQAIIKEINTRYTIKPNAQALYDEAANSAPLTVTLDARQSQDPSNTTIPSNNFYRYYRDVDGVEKVIGKGSVVKYTFRKEGSYKVRLTVRSVNNNEEGIFDGEQVLDINVAPQAANIVVFANGKKMNDQIPTKIGTQEAQKNVRFDGSATSPLGGRQILWHEWEIVGDNKFSQKSAANTPPSVYTLSLGSNGLYKVKLSVRDNEGNTVIKEYQLVVSDPVATIKMTPKDGGNTSSTYSFDASTSYSVVSNLKTFSWTIYDQEGNSITSIQNQKTIQKNFPEPGTYTVVLKVTDEQGQENQDALKVFVDSTSPIPQFTMTETEQRLYPSQYILDASATSDYDVTNGVDALSYEWSFSNGESAKVEKEFDNKKRVLVSFNEKGNYTIRLTVKDNFGKITTIEKALQIESSLRPYIYVTPIATSLGNTTNFIVKSNKALASYEWDFGDQGKNIVQSDKISHTYKRTGAYKVKLKVTTPSGEQNEVEALAFIGERNAPIPSYKVLNKDGTIVMPEAFCDQPGVGSTSAYNVDRYEDITLDASESVNINGETSSLRYYFKPINEDVSQRQQFRHKFDQLGCQMVDFTVEDIKAGKTSSTKIWFNVQNSKPTLDNLRISFPQYGNTYGVGIGQDAAQKDIFTIEYDPLIVRIDAVNARDLDGGYNGISKYKWYYYNTADPERILEVKVTPGSTPYAYFSVPKIAGEYRFGVELYDNDDVVGIMSEKIIGNGPVVVFPPDSKNPDIPVVTLIVDRPTAKVGEAVSLEVKANVLTNSDDFMANRIIKYDFDGDGIDDLSTKDSKVTYVYEKDGIYTPRVKVTYRGRSGIAKGQSVNVEKGTKAQFLYATVGTKMIVRDISLGDITSKTFCLDVKTCKTSSNMFIENRSYFTAIFPALGKYAIQYDVADKYGNTSRQRGVVELTAAGTADVNIVTLPAPTATAGGNPSIQVGKGLDNTVLFYIDHIGTGDCFVDKDIALDSNKDGTPDQDRDIACNQETMIKYVPKFDSSIARVYYSKDGKVASKDIAVQFIDFDNTLPEELKKVYNDLDILIDTAPSNATFLKSLLLNLRNNLIDSDASQSIIVQLHDYLDNNPDNIDANLKIRIVTAIDPLTTESGQSALGGTDYQNAKQGILHLLPVDKRLEAENLFVGIESADGDKGTIRDALDKILSMANESFTATQIDAEDMSQIQQERCRIVTYYEIEGTDCATALDETAPSDVVKETSSSGFGSILTIVLWIVGILGGGFIILVIIFAIKAKMQKKEEEGTPPPPVAPTS